MENREAISLLNEIKQMDDSMYAYNPAYMEALDLAISALEKQEQTNAQNVNSTHRSCPNALESLNILEQAKDDKGRVPMSLVRQAFRNVIEQAVDKSCKTCKHRKLSASIVSFQDLESIFLKSSKSGGRIMTTVNCYLEKCIHNKDCICTKDTITLDEEHYCIGGCDDGWEFPPEEEEEEDEAEEDNE